MDTSTATSTRPMATLSPVTPPVPAVTVVPGRTRVCVLAGGWSDEREVSRRSGASCAAALRETGFVVDELDPAADGFLGALTAGNYDVAFVALHGRYGEDGRIQGLLDIMGIPYTFSGVTAHALAMEKNLAKVVCAAAGIATPAGVTLPVGTSLGTAAANELVERLGTPLIVKPAANGSSFGVSKVTRAADLPAAVARAAAGGQNVLVEQCVEGMEVTAPVIGGSEVCALPVVEIVTGAEFYDETVKYEPGELHHVLPARLPADVYNRVQELAIAAHRALGCAGCSRSDFIVRADGTPVLLETNTIPGMTETSLLPDSARRAGITFPQLCRLFVEYALG